MITTAYKILRKAAGSFDIPLLLVAAMFLTLMFTACDTTEEGMEVCSKSDIAFDLSVKELTFSASASDSELTVKGNVEWEVSSNNDAFECTPKSGRGEGKVTVHARQNLTTEVVRGTITVTAVNTGSLFQPKTVSVEQLFRNFEVKTPPAQTSFPQVGGQTYFEFESTVSWAIDVLDANNNPIDASAQGFSVSPLSGEGAYSGSTRVNVAFARNDTDNVRTVKLRVRAQNDNDASTVGKLMPEYTFTQDAAVAPMISAVVASDSMTENSAELLLSYSSATPVSGCGVYMESEGASRRKIQVSASSFEFSGSNISLSIDGLESGVAYTATPYIETTLGETLGNKVEFTTLYGLRFGTVTHTEDITSVTFRIMYSSLLPVSEIVMKIFDASGNQVTSANAMSGLVSDGTNSEVTLTCGDLAQDTNYSARISGVYKSKDGVSHQVDYPIAVEFTTGTRKPGEDDNKPFRKPSR